MERTEWIEAFATALGVPAPSETEVQTVLEVAALAAHASERTAAPVACWIAAQAGLSVDQAVKVAREVGSGTSQVETQ